MQPIVVTIRPIVVTIRIIIAAIATKATARNKIIGDMALATIKHSGLSKVLVFLKRAAASNAIAK